MSFISASEVVTFTSLTFILFLAGVFSLYWLLEDRTHQNILLVAASFVFYSWWDYRFCGLMLAASLIDYFGAIALHGSVHERQRWQWLILSLSSNLALLGFFKYFGFFLENLHALARAVGWPLHPVTLNIVLPVGISFYTFQSMSYSIDVYRRRLEPCRNPLDYLAFVTFFPQLVAGPIERATVLLPQFRAKRQFDYGMAVDGCRQILWGFLKKMVLADRLAEIVDRYYGQPNTTSGSVLAFATFCFAFQIYCDFSAYSDIAVGVAKLFGIRLMRNFAYPYFSQSIGEFWRRWHISLSTWFRDYVYIPLGGGQGQTVQRARNAMATFLISGLWHGASWTYVSWGGLNGAALVPAIFFGKQNKTGSDMPGGDKLLPTLSTALRMVRTFVFVSIAWIFFRANSLHDALFILNKCTGCLWEPGAYSSLAALMADHRVSRTLAFLLAFIGAEWVQRRWHHPLHLPQWPQVGRWALYTLLFWITLHYGTESSSQFVYFQF